MPVESAIPPESASVCVRFAYAGLCRALAGSLIADTWKHETDRTASDSRFGPSTPGSTRVRLRRTVASGPSADSDVTPSRSVDSDRESLTPGPEPLDGEMVDSDGQERFALDRGDARIDAGHRGQEQEDASGGPGLGPTGQRVIDREGRFAATVAGEHLGQPVVRRS